MYLFNKILSIIAQQLFLLLLSLSAIAVQSQLALADNSISALPSGQITNNSPEVIAVQSQALLNQGMNVSRKGAYSYGEASYAQRLVEKTQRKIPKIIPHLYKVQSQIALADNSISAFSFEQIANNSPQLRTRDWEDEYVYSVESQNVGFHRSEFSKTYPNQILKEFLPESPVYEITQRIIPTIPSQDIPRSLPPQPKPQQTPEKVPLPEDLLPTPTTPQPSPESPDTTFDNLFVSRFEVVGSTVFSSKELTDLLKDYTGRNITFTELLQARSAITNLYIKNGYISSAAVIPPQNPENGVVKIQVIEGSLEDIKVNGIKHLYPSYISDRIGLATTAPLNINRLLEGLRLLQLDPLIENISADLQAGTSPGKNVLEVTIIEAKTLSVSALIDNNRSPSVGSVRRQIELREANLLGFGDALQVGYTNTDASNRFDFNYTIPLNPRNGTLSLAYGTSNSSVIEPPFDQLDIQANSSYYELTYRQPIFQQSREEFALGLTLSHQQTQTKLGIDNIGGFPLSPGADDQGKTRVSAIRFFQDWVERDERQVLAARSQFSLGVGVLDATINDSSPDSNFFSWRGQGQWTRLLAPDTLLIMRGDIQLSERPLLPLEQIGIGGQQTVRGYRQDALLTDNGVLFSTELRLPILKTQQSGGVLQLTPFIDMGVAWNNGNNNNSDSNTLIGTGLGLLWQEGDFSARIDYGIPLISIDTEKRTLQDNGIYFSIRYNPSF
ncbi:ShlB/FhaC/HecB family hemolysin secretion/activation protein [Nostoc sp. NMS8]|uniref:ShlB/FhaC/HecB family hemolysin secretion/activation protein n=1 Tax=Nostoc sp. NMS8 TaxID=2815392 RepID=UPI0025F65D3A|nr:ShlB/FhaC/HecB family hemolysin secretion/activation protein [Nostoc sp. NMS8]